MEILNSNGEMRQKKSANERWIARKKIHDNIIIIIIIFINNFYEKTNINNQQENSTHRESNCKH